MIDTSLVRKTLRKPILAKALVAGSGFPNAAVGYAWENTNFEPPTDGSMWMRETLLPISERLASNDLIQFDAFVQYDIITVKGNGTELAERVRKALGDIFKPASSLTDPTTVYILRSEPLRGAIDGSWWITPIRLTIQSIIQR